MIQTFIPKDDSKLPDNYSVDVHYIDGHSDSFEIATHVIKEGILMFMTKEDFMNWIPLSAIKRVEFDKRWSKIIAINEKHEKDAASKANS